MQPNTQIDQYTIQRPLGSGGMADVYLAWDGRNQWPVALKLMNAAAMSNPQLQERFRREVAVASRLRHPHLVQLYNWGKTADGRHYLVMEYIDGGSLSGLISRYVADGQTVPPANAAYLLRRVAGAMAYVHAQGIIHRDLKPANILIRGDNGEPAVTDLGIASISGANPLTGTMEALGTPHYMAPEQASGASPTDARSDVYAMGVMLCEMICGRLPFQGETSWAIMNQKINSDPPTLSQLRRGVDPALAAIATRCMQRDPARRYQTAGALASALDGVLPNAVAEIKPPPLAPPLDAPTGGQSGYGTRGRATPQTGSQKRSLSPLLLIGVAALALVLALALFLPRGGSGGGQTAGVTPGTSSAEAPAKDSETAGANGEAESAAPANEPAPTSTIAIAVESEDAGDEDALLNEASEASIFAVKETTSSAPTGSVPDEIVFQSNRDGDYEIYIMATDGSDQRQLTRNTADDRYPHVSPDGRWIAFESDREGSTFEVYVMARDGSDPRRLTFNSYNDRLPAFSPDSSRLVFARWIGDDSELYIIDRDGGNERQVTNTLEDEGHASWSPDGRLLVNADRPDASYWQLYLVNIDGSGHRRLTNSTYDEWSAEWSPDGSQILFLSERESRTNPGIFVMDADGGNVRRVYDGPTMEWGARWSADGRQIVFAVDQPDGTAEVYIMDVASGTARSLTRGGYPAWAAAIGDGATSGSATSEWVTLDENQYGGQISQEMELVVRGNAERTYSGIYLGEQQRVLIEVLDGSWRAGTAASWGMVGPEGDPAVATKRSFPIPDRPLMSLIAGVEEATPLAVGQGIGFTSPVRGELWLGPNDDGVDDNAGTLRVRITVAAP